MKVLLVEDERSARLATTKLAESLGHEVEAVESAEDAMTVLSRGGIDLLFTDLVLPKRNGLELVQWLRSRETETHLYVLLLTSRDGAKQMEAAFAAGIDDFVTKGASLAEISARFRVAERITRVERHLRARADELESALRRLDISAAMRTKAAPKLSMVPQSVAKKEILSDVRAWGTVESTLKAAMAANTQRTLSQATAPQSWGSNAIASCIKLTDVDHKVEIELTLVAEHACVHAIACTIFGDPELVDEAVVADTMLELSNGTMGAIKTAFHAEEWRFTPGIPKPVKASTAMQLLDKATDKRVFAFGGEGGVLTTVLVGVREKRNRILKAGALKEGMVLAANLMRNGALLLKSGTRLSEGLIERLRGVDKDLSVELCDPEDTSPADVAA